MGIVASYCTLCNPISTDIYIIAYGIVNILNIQQSCTHDQPLTMLCTVANEHFHFKYYNVVYCHVLWALLLCAMGTASYCMLWTAMCCEQYCVVTEALLCGTSTAASYVAMCCYIFMLWALLHIFYICCIWYHSNVMLHLHT